MHPVFTIRPPDREDMLVNVPYRCLLPKDLDSILVTGLGVSAHRDAMPVIRMQPDIQNQGYAAGVAAAMAAELRAGSSGVIQTDWALSGRHRRRSQGAAPQAYRWIRRGRSNAASGVEGPGECPRFLNHTTSGRDGSRSRR